jgi:formate dehydrogenase iron-sulfur subunit
VGGFGAFFMLLDEPEVYGLPPDPVVPTKDLPEMWRNTAVAAAATAVVIALAFIGGRA